MVPPFVGVAVNVTLVPAHIVEDGLAAIATLTGTLGVTVIVIEFDVAGLPSTPTRLDVITQVITSPVTSVVVE